MGVNNRERRRAKRQKRETRERADRIRTAWASRPAGGRDPGQSDEEVARRAVLAAAETFPIDPAGLFVAHVATLDALRDRGRRALVSGAVSWGVDHALGRAWANGWQPADVVRLLRRELSAAHVEVMAGAVAASASRAPDAAADERWAAQVKAIEADARRPSAAGPWPDLRLALESLSVVIRIPPLPRLTAARHSTSSARAGDSSAMLERVRALLAKAESTTFPEEAEALTAKAQQLMTRHAIDQAMLDESDRGQRSGVVAWRIGVDDPYAGPKSILLDRIADAGGCRAVWSKQLGFSTVFGPRGAVEMAEILFTSLLVQATDAMVRAGRAVDRSGRSRTRSFRQSFLVAYAQRIGERLSKAAADAVAEGTGRHGEALLPVLARRAEAVNEAVRSAFPRLAQGGTQVNNYNGWLAGRAAAEVASLSAGGELATG